MHLLHNTGVASALGEWRSHFIILENLASLSVQSAYLLAIRDHALVLGIESLTVDVAKALSCKNGWLVFQNLNSITKEVAVALARHTDALEITLRNGLPLIVARELIQHQGYRLTITLCRYPDDELIAVLSSNPKKHRPRISRILDLEKWVIDICAIGFDGVV